MSRTNDLWMDEYEKCRDEYVKDQDTKKLFASMMELGFEPCEINEHIEAFCAHPTR